MRYLGLIAELSVQRPNLDHLYRLCVIEMISRTAKRILQKDMQQGSYSIISHYIFDYSTVSLHNVVTIVVYFLNCYLVSVCHRYPMCCVTITPCTVLPPIHYYSIQYPLIVLP